MALDERCDWCGKDVAADVGYRAAEPVGERVATFCRLEHVVPWAMQGAHWRAGVFGAGPRAQAGPAACAQCGGPVDDTRILLVHHRGDYRIADAFCCVDHLRAWAQGGGRWR